MRYKAGIFDLDDTLYDYKSLNNKAMECVYEHMQTTVKITKKHSQEIFMQARNDLKHRLGNVAASHNRAIYFKDMLEHCGCFSAERCLELYDIYWNYMLEHMVLREGVISFFNEMRVKEITIVICTDLTAHIQLRKITQLGLDKFVDFVVTSEEAGEEKPGTKIFNLCKEKLDVLPEECFFVGDSFNRDIKGAKEAGMHPVWFTQNKNMEVSPAIIQVSSFTELQDICFPKKG